MNYQNNHFVPQFLLKKFGEKINTYDLDAGLLKMQQKPCKVFCGTSIYEEQLEKLLNTNAESKVANLLFNKIINAENEVVLDRWDLLLLKKFFVIEQLRSPDSKEYISRQRDYFKGKSIEHLRNIGYFPNASETLPDNEYLNATLRCVLEYDGFGEQDFLTWLKKPNTTLVAQKWMRIYNACYIAIWDSSKVDEDFLITDEGMFCEHDPSKFMYPYDTELLKPGFLISLLESPDTTPEQKSFILAAMKGWSEVSANFYFVPLTPRRIVMMVDPFFRTFDKEDPWRLEARLPSPDFWPSGFSDKSLVEKNKCVYEDPVKANNHDFSEKDRYLYKIHDMKLEDVLYCNCLTLDRVGKTLGFGETRRILRSLACYLQIPKPLKNYRKLKVELENLGYEVPASQKYKDLARGFAENPIKEALRAQKYIDYSLKMMGADKHV